MSGLRSRLAALREPLSLARALVVALFVVIALTSTVRTWPDTWDAFRNERNIFVGQAGQPPLAFAARSAAVDPGVLDFYAARLRPGDRYAFQVPPDMPAPGYQAMLEISALALLPAVRVERRAEADVLLSYNADPRGLELGQRSEQAGAQPYFVTRLRP